jgi:hypothetical protein
MSKWDPEIISYAQGLGTCSLAAVNFHNFKRVNALLSQVRGDVVLVSAREALGRLGRTWRTEGDGFTVCIEDPFARAQQLLQDFSWVFRLQIAGTETWRFKFSDGRALPLVPRSTISVQSTPRCGLAEVTARGAADALAQARTRCHAARLSVLEGFAPLGDRDGTSVISRRTPSCPICASEQLEVVQDEPGPRFERCESCHSVYTREAVVNVFGEWTFMG